MPMEGLGPAEPSRIHPWFSELIGKSTLACALILRRTTSIGACLWAMPAGAAPISGATTSIKAAADDSSIVEETHWRRGYRYYYGGYYPYYYGYPTYSYYYRSPYPYYYSYPTYGSYYYGHRHRHHYRHYRRW